MSGDVQTDLSGNPILKDVGPWLKSEIKKRFKDADVKYIDPSYLIRSIPTTSNDRIYCKILAHNAVHAAFAGFTGVTVGLVNTHYVLLPIPVVIQAPRRVSLHLFTVDNSRPDSLFRQDSNTCCMQPQVACDLASICRRTLQRQQAWLELAWCAEKASCLGMLRRVHKQPHVSGATLIGSPFLLKCVLLSMVSQPLCLHVGYLSCTTAVQDYLTVHLCCCRWTHKASSGTGCDPRLDNLNSLQLMPPHPLLVLVFDASLLTHIIRMNPNV